MNEIINYDALRNQIEQETNISTLKGICICLLNAVQYNSGKPTAKLDNCTGVTPNIYIQNNYYDQSDCGKVKNMLRNDILADYIDEWLNVEKKNTVKDSTFNRLLVSKATLMRYSISNMGISDITRRDIQEHINELVEDGYGLSTIKKQVQIITAPLKSASANHEIPSDPSIGIKWPSEDKLKRPYKITKAYDNDEQARLWAVLASKAYNGYSANALMLETGLRVGEALALRWNDVDFKKRALHIHSTVVDPTRKSTAHAREGAKTKSSNRKVPLSEKALEILKDLYDTRQNEWVFVNVYGEMLTYAALTYQTRQACIKAEIEYRGQHAFRHTFATNQYYKGTDVKILSKLLGHATPSITYNVYIHLYGDGFKEMLEAVS